MEFKFSPNFLVVEICCSYAYKHRITYLFLLLGWIRIPGHLNASSTNRFFLWKIPGYIELGRKGREGYPLFLAVVFRTTFPLPNCKQPLHRLQPKTMNSSSIDFTSNVKYSRFMWTARWKKTSVTNV